MTKIPVPAPCFHLYGLVEGGCSVSEDNYKLQEKSINFIRFTYCPYCRVQLHTLDGIPLGLPVDEDDCLKGGCED